MWWGFPKTMRGNVRSKVSWWNNQFNPCSGEFLLVRTHKIYLYFLINKVRSKVSWWNNQFNPCSGEFLLGHIRYIYTFLIIFQTPREHIYLTVFLTMLMKDRYRFFQHSLYHGCWWPGATRSQDINSDGLNMLSQNMLVSAPEVNNFRGPIALRNKKLHGATRFQVSGCSKDNLKIVKFLNDLIFWLDYVQACLHLGSVANILFIRNKWVEQTSLKHLCGCQVKHLPVQPPAQVGSALDCYTLLAWRL